MNLRICDDDGCGGDDDYDEYDDYDDVMIMMICEFVNL